MGLCRTEDFVLSTSLLLLLLLAKADRDQRASVARWRGVLSTVSIHLMLYHTSYTAVMQLIRVPLYLTRTHIAPLADTMCGPPCNLKIALFLRDMFSLTFIRLTSKAYRCYMTLTYSPSVMTARSYSTALSHQISPFRKSYGRQKSGVVPADCYCELCSIFVLIL